MSSAWLLAAAPYLRGVTGNKHALGYLLQCLSGTILDPKPPQALTGTFYLPALSINLMALYNVKCHSQC